MKVQQKKSWSWVQEISRDTPQLLRLSNKD